MIQKFTKVTHKSEQAENTKSVERLKNQFSKNKIRIEQNNKESQWP